MLSLLRKWIPEPLLSSYHFALAHLSAFVYGYPSRKLIVIGVTGTNGKSSTTQLLGQLLEELGETVGYTTTAGFRIAGKDRENKMKMTMPGRFYLQRLLRDMVREGCTYAIIESSSEGMRQHRHLGINYDAAVFTNLTPEHLERHGGFENYKKAKGKLFAHLAHRPHKTLQGAVIPKVSIINADDMHGDYFASFWTDRTVLYSWQPFKGGDRVTVELVQQTASGVEVKVNDIPMELPLKAHFQQKNLIAALSTLYALGWGFHRLKDVLPKVHSIAGRFESIEAGQPFDVIVDYAYEPYALQAVYESVEARKPKRIIGIHGAAGGGRDTWKRKEIGKLAAEKNAITILTNEDPYDEDPRQIIEAVAEGAREAGAKEGDDLLLIEDRKEAIQKAIDLAKKGDCVLITGKGSELVMAVAGGKKIAWSDKQEALTALEKAGYGQSNG
jgi:UDP-N-acetylmuramoyl-L-alanyl-D-glutamate--2,6-diaminopimelate ligase